MKAVTFQGIKDVKVKEVPEDSEVETYDFTKHDNMGEYIKEITSGGADVVIDCVGMDGKMTAMEVVEMY